MLEELMINDIVLFADEQVKVTSIENCGYCNSRVFIKHQDGDIWPTHHENIKPMPLTKEILEKNGFKSQLPKNHLETVYAYQDVSEAVANELYALWPYQDGSFYLLLRVDGKDMVRMNVHYVHQLQHALRLCGIEKEIIL